MAFMVGQGNEFDWRPNGDTEQNSMNKHKIPAKCETWLLLTALK